MIQEQQQQKMTSENDDIFHYNLFILPSAPIERLKKSNNHTRTRRNRENMHIHRYNEILNLNAGENRQKPALHV